ncbi:MAG: GtrA family protein [Alistipes sp.]|nr:GtrA family protein [Alistipes sp.]
MRKFVPQQIFRYGACGAANMTLDAVWYFIIYNFIVAKQFVDLGFVVISPHILSLIIVFPITFFTGFWLNRNVAFRTTHIESRKQLLRYLLTVLGSILINYASMKLLVEHAHLWATPSKIITTVISTVYSYLVARYYTFR